MLTRLKVFVLSICAILMCSRDSFSSTWEKMWLVRMPQGCGSLSGRAVRWNTAVVCMAWSKRWDCGTNTWIIAWSNCVSSRALRMLVFFVWWKKGVLLLLQWLMLLLYLLGGSRADVIVSVNIWEGWYLWKIFVSCVGTVVVDFIDTGWTACWRFLRKVPPVR